MDIRREGVVKQKIGKKDETIISGAALSGRRVAVSTCRNGLPRLQCVYAGEL